MRKNNLGFPDPSSHLIIEIKGLTFTFQKFEGDIERENAESLAADIAEFLNNRRNRTSSETTPVRTFSFCNDNKTVLNLLFRFY